VATRTEAARAAWSIAESVGEAVGVGDAVLVELGVLVLVASMVPEPHPFNVASTAATMQSIVT
jgi:hypothetical protein